MLISDDVTGNIIYSGSGVVFIEFLSGIALGWLFSEPCKKHSVPIEVTPKFW